MVKNPNHDKVLIILRDLVNSAISIGDAHKKLLDEFGQKEEVLMGATEAQLPEARGPVEFSEFKGPDSDPIVEAANEENNDGLYPLKEEAPKRRGRRTKSDEVETSGKAKGNDKS